MSDFIEFCADMGWPLDEWQKWVVIHSEDRSMEMHISTPNRRMHQCPGKGCEIKVSDAILACGAHWAMLSADTKRAIYRTASMSILAEPRRKALADARREWDAV